jgi:hypothetical protein
MSIICFIAGHAWQGMGWTSNTFDKSVPPETPIANLWKCSRCGRQDRTFENLTQTGARFKKYRTRYGDAVVAAAGFSAPKPKRRG